MTTIAFRDGIVAFDSRFSEDNGTITPPGLIKAQPGRRHRVIYAWAGIHSEALTVVRKIEDMATPPWRRKRSVKLGLKDDETEIVIVTADNEVFTIDYRGWYPVRLPFLALGSGKDAALGAMYMGATARRAVAVACLVDATSGPPVNILKVSAL
jgi:hypothetical protein